MIGASPNTPHDVLSMLRERVRRIEHPTAITHGVLPFGIAAIDRALPGGGLARGGLHEILGAGGDEEDGALAAAFAASVLARLDRGGIVLWCLARTDLYGPGLAACGLDPARLVEVRARRDADILWAMEEGLHAAGVAAVVGEVGALAAVASRRLQLAAERSGITAFVLRRWCYGGLAARERNLPSAAATRWRIAALPSRPIPIPPLICGLRHFSPSVVRHPRANGCEEVRDPSFRGVGAAGEPGTHEHQPLQIFPRAVFLGSGPASGEAPRNDTLSEASFPRARAGRGNGSTTEPGIGYPRWRVELLRCRGGAPACWEVEVREGKVADATDIVPLAAELADRPSTPVGSDVVRYEKVRRTG